MSDTATQYPIPPGWRRVTRGGTRKGDKALQYDRKTWLDMPDDCQVTCYVVIRRVKGGAS